MAISNDWTNKSLKIQQETEKAEAYQAGIEAGVNEVMQIAGVTGQGGSPGQLYKPPVTNPGRGEAVYGTEKDGQRYFEFLKAMMIDPANNIRKTGVPLGDNDDGYGENPTPGHPDWQLSKGPVLPEFKPMGREIKGVRKGVLSPEENKIKQQLQIGPQAGATSRQIRDRLKPFTRGGPADYDKEGGSLRDVPDLLRPVLLRDAMAKAPANNIRRLQPDHQTVLDDNRPGHLKIIKTFKPPKA